MSPAPNLNIANTFYDLGRFQEALPYYRSALDEYLSGAQRGGIPGTSAMVRFVEDRMEQIESKIH